jgi:uncharacterized protein HemY
MNVDIGLIWAIGSGVFSGVVSYIVAAKVQAQKLEFLEKEVAQMKEQMTTHAELSSLRNEISIMKNENDRHKVESLERLRAIELKMTELATLFRVHFSKGQVEE